MLAKPPLRTGAEGAPEGDGEPLDFPKPVLRLDAPAPLTVAQVARLLGRSRMHVRALCESGQLEAVDVGLHPERRYWRIPEAALVAYARERGLVLGARAEDVLGSEPEPDGDDGEGD